MGEFVKASRMQIDLFQLNLKRLTLFGVMMIVAAGLAREGYVLSFGEETALRDLRQFSLNAEQNLASWYTSLLLAVGALLAWLAGSCDSAEPPAARRFWQLVAVLLLAAAADETVSFHEVLTLFLPGVQEMSPLLHFSWVVLALPLLAILALWCLPMMRHLPRVTFWGLVAAALLFVGGAVGLEMVAGLVIDRAGETSLAYRAVYILEDTFEMLGGAVFILVVLRHIRGRAPRLELRLTSP